MNLLDRIVAFLAPEVPPAIAACEFDCRKPNCTRAAMATCELRLATMHEMTTEDRIDEMETR